MPTLGEVGEKLRLVLDKISQAIGAAHTAADLAEDARRLVGVAGWAHLRTHRTTSGSAATTCAGTRPEDVRAVVHTRFP
ncbi:hypothetical protein AB0A63_32925 [Lentzea sp. NPDC042327]|uniref:hypothetical protein n=1 Tax=Lentzea sp. NPDC042327 TaxID=3154801 RepID=UPI0033CDF15C